MQHKETFASIQAALSAGFAYYHNILNTYSYEIYPKKIRLST